MQHVAVFCGSSPGFDPVWREKAEEVGRALVSRKINLVYGGGKAGIMGAVANSVMSAGGSVLGIIPRFMQDWEVAHHGITKLVMVDTMHERKLMMSEESDGFLTLPGGFGTMEEFFEVLTWAQLGLHHKPVAVLNTEGYYQPLIDMVDHMVDKGFVKPLYRQLVLVDDHIEGLLDQMEAYTPPARPILMQSPDQT